MHSGRDGGIARSLLEDAGATAVYDSCLEVLNSFASGLWETCHDQTGILQSVDPTVGQFLPRRSVTLGILVRGDDD